MLEFLRFFKQYFLISLDIKTSMFSLNRREFLPLPLLLFGTTILNPLSLEAAETSTMEKLLEEDMSNRERFYHQGVSIIVDGSQQRLHYLTAPQQVAASYLISTGKNGFGNTPGTGKTPTGAHTIYKKFGDGAPLGRIFKGRADTGKNTTIYHDETDVADDHVTTRILWLRGIEPGINLDNHFRHIYIHGTPEEGLLGSPVSHGCVRMRNKDVVSLYNKTPVGTLVTILE
jgi:hypothetical protein